MTRAPSRIRKSKALHPGSTLALISPSSPAPESEISAGVQGLQRLGYKVEHGAASPSDGYFAASSKARIAEFIAAISGKNSDGLIACRGGYGSNYLLESNLAKYLKPEKCVVGFSDLTTLQIFLWQTRGWVTFYGPMVASGFNHGANQPKGYDQESFLKSVTTTKGKWNIPLQGEVLNPGEYKGILLGGCLTLVEATIGTKWELHTANSILLLEDVGMKPYQVDRALMHLVQAGKFRGVRGIILGDFPGGESLVPGSPNVKQVCDRILGPLGVPVIYGAAVGHTARPMLTIPLGIRARLQAKGTGNLEIMEPAVID
jgi:muramoyltetrapeptide carboxypeptidase